MPATVPGITDAVIAATITASHNVYARAYLFAWIPIIPFVVVAMVCIACLKGVAELMTEHVEATVERMGVKGEPLMSASRMRRRRDLNIWSRYYSSSLQPSAPLYLIFSSLSSGECRVQGTYLWPSG
jgi:hypothetical protein